MKKKKLYEIRKAKPLTINYENVDVAPQQTFFIGEAGKNFEISTNNIKKRQF